jgi:hypothetical protein
MEQLMSRLKEDASTNNQELEINAMAHGANWNHQGKDVSEF